jgi:hypothetical protein
MKQQECDALTDDQSEKTQARTHLPMRVPSLRYRNSLRKAKLRAQPAYAESKSDPAVAFFLNSLSTHSTKNL